MTTKPNHRTWVAPIIAVVFAFTALTGLLKAFDMDIPGTKEVHSLLGISLVIAGLTHLTLNWKVLVYYLKQHRAALVGLFAGIVLVLALVGLGIHATLTEPPEKGGGHAPTESASLMLGD